MHNWWGNIQFENPEMLLLLWLVPIAGSWYAAFYGQRYPTLRMSTIEFIDQEVSWRILLRKTLPIWRSFAFIALVLALARPQKKLQEEKIVADGIDIGLVMDLSSSMLAQDFEPNRLEASKRVASEFVDKRLYDRIGLAVFSGEALTQCPLTTDHLVLKEFLSNLQCGMLEDGTAIGMGLATAINRLKDSETKSKVVILLTDGVNNGGYIKPLTAAEIAREFKVKVYTIGVGTTGNVITPVDRGLDGEYIYGPSRVEIDETLLNQIAEMTDGRYFRATSTESLEQIYDEIDQLEKTEIEVTVINNYSEEFFRFAFLGLLFIVLELTLRYTVLRTIP